MTNYQHLNTDAAGTTRLIENIASELGSRHFLREFVQNSFEAGAENVYLQPYATSFATKQAIIDDGCGMSEQELLDLLGSFAKTGNSTGNEGNFGIGARVSGLVQNPYGLMYLSWQNGDGYMATIAKDEDGLYGLQQNDDNSYIGPVNPAIKPKEIGDHGTMVLFMGESEEDQTAFPEGISTAYIYLQKRFWDLSHCRVKAPTASGKGSPVYTTVKGYKDACRQVSIRGKGTSGTVQLSSAKVHWYLLDGEKDADGNLRHSRTTTGLKVGGGTSVLWKNERYESKVLPGSYWSQERFGISLQNKLVELIIEPDEDLVAVNTNRINIRIDGDPLSMEHYTAWGNEFRAKMPAPIADMLSKALSELPSGENREDMIKRVKNLLDEVNVGRYKRTPTGTDVADGKSSGANGTGRKLSDDPKPSANGKRSVNDFLAYQAKSGDRAKPMPPKFNWPEIKWADETSLEPLKDRGVVYVESSNTIFLNTEWRLFKSLREQVTSNLPSFEGAGDIAWQTIMVFVEEKVTTSVIISLSMTSRTATGLWKPEDIKRILSAEALTGVVNTVINDIPAIKRQANRVAKKHIALAA